MKEEDLFFRAGLAAGRLSRRAKKTWRATRSAFGAGLRSAAPVSPERRRLAELYARLELPMDAGPEEVDRAWKTLLRKYHPDRFAGDPERLRRATELTQALNEARAELRRHLGVS